MYSTCYKRLSIQLLVAAVAKTTVRKDAASGFETDPSYIRRWKKDRLLLYIHKQTYSNGEKNCNFCIKPNYANIWRKYTFPWCQTCFHLGWHFQSCWEAKNCLHPFPLKLVWNEGECYNEKWVKERNVRNKDTHCSGRGKHVDNYFSTVIRKMPMLKAQSDRRPHGLLNFLFLRQEVIALKPKFEPCYIPVMIFSRMRL